MNSTTSAVLGWSIFVMLMWVGPTALAAWMLNRKGHSPHWAWFGVVPIVSLVVLLVALLLTAKAEKRDVRTAQPAEDTTLAWEKYQSGMKQLGNGLIALGVLAMLAAALVLWVGEKGGPPGVVVFIGIMAALYFVMGWLARQLHAWVNYIVIVLACLSLGVNFLNMGAAGQNADRANPGGSLGLLAGIVVAAALLFYSINNLQRLKRARAKLESGKRIAS